MGAGLTADEEDLGLDLAVTRLQLIMRRNAGMPPYLDDATEDERDAYRELVEAAHAGDPAARRRLGRKRRRTLESLAR